MADLVSYAVPVLIGWYTFNIARLAWVGGNKAGAVLTGALAVAATGFPVAVLLAGKG